MLLKMEDERLARHRTFAIRILWVTAAVLIAFVVVFGAQAARQIAQDPPPPEMWWIYPIIGGVLLGIGGLIRYTLRTAGALREAEARIASLPDDTADQTLVRLVAREEERLASLRKTMPMTVGTALFIGALALLSPWKSLYEKLMMVGFGVVALLAHFVGMYRTRNRLRALENLRSSST